MKAGEYELTRGTRFVARRIEVVAIAGLLWISWCIWGGADFFVLFFPDLFFFKRPRSAASMRPSCLIYLSTSKKLFSPRCGGMENFRKPVTGKNPIEAPQTK